MSSEIKDYNKLVFKVNELVNQYTIDEIKNDKDKKIHIEKLVQYNMPRNEEIINSRDVIAQYKEVYNLKDEEIGVIKVNSALNPVSFFITNYKQLTKDILTHKAFSSFIICNEKHYNDVNLSRFSMFSLNTFQCLDKICVNDLPKVKNKKSIGVSSEEKESLSMKSLDYLKEIYFDNCIGKDYDKDKEEIMLNLISYTKFLENEHLTMFGIDDNNKISTIREINIGRETSSHVSITNFIKFIEENKNCHEFVTFHNHPTGILYASSADIKIWQELNSLSGYFNADIKNHFILGKDGYYDRSYDQMIKIEKSSELKKNLLLEDVKKALIGYCSREFGNNYSYENFSRYFPDEKHIGIAYTTTPDQNHEIQYKLNLKDMIGTQFIDGEVITIIDYVKKFGSEEKALEVLKEEFLYCNFDDYVKINEDDLRKTLGLEIDDDGNLFAPKEQKLNEVKLEKAENTPFILKKIDGNKLSVKTNSIKNNVSTKDISL